MIGIYKITSPSGKVYIGQSWDIERRHKDYYKNSCYKQCKLYHSILKYGIDAHNFEVLHILPETITQKELDDLEVEEIGQHRNRGIHLLNITLGGSRGRHSEETKRLLSILAKRRKRRRPTNESNVKRSNTMKRYKKERGYTYNKEQINKMNTAARRPIIQLTIENKFIKEWASITEAATSLSTSASCLVQCLKGKTKTSSGFIWRYKNQ